MGSCAYPKAARIRRRREFLRLQHEGRRRHTPHFVVIKRPAGTDTSRVGLTVSSRVGNSVVRNRVKRLLREVFRQRRLSMPRPADVVIIATPGAHDLTYAQVATELEQALELPRP